VRTVRWMVYAGGVGPPPPPQTIILPKITSQGETDVQISACKKKATQPCSEGGKNTTGHSYSTCSNPPYMPLANAGMGVSYMVKIWGVDRE
jgi:hypothetical protein